MTLIEGSLFCFGLTVFAFSIAWLHVQVTAYTIFCACGYTRARKVRVVGKYDAADEVRLRESLTENCPNCRHLRANRQSTIDNRQSKGFSHVS